MSDVVFAIFLAGCSHMLGVCREEEAPVQAFATEQVCEEHLKSKMLDMKQFPVSIGKCVEVSSNYDIAQTEFDWFFARNGHLMVEAVTVDSKYTALDDDTEVVTADNG